jgi:phenylacetic acid degradation operon negative regulatory protein
MRPESLLLAFFGAHVLGRRRAVAVGSIIELLDRLGVGEHATRATLARMADRGLLKMLRRGRRAYAALLPYAEDVLREGATRLDAEVVNRSWDGHWTLLAFSVPESRRADRHTLRSHLAWAGFGPLRSGLWIAHSPADVRDALRGLGLLDYVRIFRAQPQEPADPSMLVADAWDLETLAKGYRGFIERWERGVEFDELAQQTLLEAEWLLLIREDPRLPIVLLPDDWPGTAAEKLFRSLRRRLGPPARRSADTTLDVLALEGETAVALSCPG